MPTWELFSVQIACRSAHAASEQSKWSHSWFWKGLRRDLLPHLSSIWTPLGSIWAPLGFTWGVLEFIWTPLVPTGTVHEPHCAPLGGRLGLIRLHLNSLWLHRAPFGPYLGSISAPSGCRWDNTRTTYVLSGAPICVCACLCVFCVLCVLCVLCVVCVVCCVLCVFCVLCVCCVLCVLCVVCVLCCVCFVCFCLFCVFCARNYILT